MTNANRGYRTTFQYLDLPIQFFQLKYRGVLLSPTTPATTSRTRTTIREMVEVCDCFGCGLSAAFTTTTACVCGCGRAKGRGSYFGAGFEGGLVVPLGPGVVRG